MNQGRPPFIPYPPIERLSVIGDRRTAATVAADGTICWWCLPDYDGRPVFGALLDAERGGYFRLGPAAAVLGEQKYVPDTAVLMTRWEQPDGVVELTDAMLWPETDRPPEYRDRRTIVRRLRGVRGGVRCVGSISARPDFEPPAVATPNGFALEADGPVLSVWSSRPALGGCPHFSNGFNLNAGDEVWVVLGPGETPAEWTVDRARDALEATLEYWRRWSEHLKFHGARADRVKQSALLVHLLSYAPTGAPVAAPTASLPERIGGSRNYDYRYAWVRDASLSLSLLSELGFTGDDERYLDWLAQLPAGEKMPLQTVYRVDGGTEAPLRRRDDLNGYRESRPVQFGNPAFKMMEIGSFGFLADCVRSYVERGGKWKDEYWRLMRRAADFVVDHWQEPDRGIWELELRCFVSSRVLSWCVLDRAHQDRRAVRPRRCSGYGVARRNGRNSRRNHGARLERHDEFVPPALRRRHGRRRVAADPASRVSPSRSRAGSEHRRADRGAPDDQRLRLPFRRGGLSRPGEAAARRGGGRLRDVHLLAGALLRAAWPAGSGRRDPARVESTSATGVLAEAIDGRTGGQLGNTPLLFSQVEYAKAAMAQAGVDLDPGPSRRR